MKQFIAANFFLAVIFYFLALFCWIFSFILKFCPNFVVTKLYFIVAFLFSAFFDLFPKFQFSLSIFSRQYFRYDKIRELEARQQEEKDEEYVKSLFGKVGPDAVEGSHTQGNQRIKRILDEDDSSDDDSEKKRITKKIKTEKV